MSMASIAMVLNAQPTHHVLLAIAKIHYVLFVALIIISVSIQSVP
jgi:hypothetical protein